MTHRFGGQSIVVDRFSLVCRTQWQRKGLQEFRKGRAARLSPMFRFCTWSHGPLCWPRWGGKERSKGGRCKNCLASGLEMDGANVIPFEAHLSRAGAGDGAKGAGPSPR